MAQHEAAMPDPSPESHNPIGPDSARPPRNAVVLESGVLMSPWASNHTTSASGWKRATTGRVANATAQRVRAVTGVCPAA